MIPSYQHSGPKKSMPSGPAQAAKVAQRDAEQHPPHCQAVPKRGTRN